MLGPKRKRTEKLYYYGFSLEKRMPEDHLLRRIEEAVEFGFVREMVRGLYGYNGHQSDDPVVIVKRMLLLFLGDVKRERELMRVLPMRLDWLWFLELDLDSEVPHHSVLSKAREGWGREVFEGLFVQVVRECVKAGLVGGHKIHVDGSLVDADASRDSVREQGIGRVYEEQEQKLVRLEVGGERELESRTDPDAAGVRRGRADVSRPRYKHHRAVDDGNGVVTAVRTTSGDGHEADQLEELIEGHERSTGESVGTVVGDHQYGTNGNYRVCVGREIRCHLGDVKSKMARGNGRRGFLGWRPFATTGRRMNIGVRRVRFCGAIGPSRRRRAVTRSLGFQGACVGSVNGRLSARDRRRGGGSNGHWTMPLCRRVGSSLGVKRPVVIGSDANTSWREALRMPPIGIISRGLAGEAWRSSPFRIT